MSAAPSLGLWTALALGVIAVAACVRLVLWRRRAPEAERGAPWRLALLLAAQPLLAVLLYLGLFPPPLAGVRAGTLTIATRDAPRSLAPAGERLIVLPEAPAGLGGEAAPDLATALRRHPEAARLRVLGQGLEPRDRPAAQGRAVVFDPAPTPVGVAELYPPAPAAPGAGFSVSGRVNGASGGTVDLVDPAGQVVDSAPLPASGEFTLAGAARDPGPALFGVRLRNAGRTLETVDVPVWTAPAPAPKVLLLAGAPGPEIKALRRWAADSGVALQAVVAAGDGLELGDPRPPLNAATLGRLDLVVVDERSWAGLSAGDRAALAAAAREGLGLLLRVTGPLPAGVRDSWRALGLPLGDGETTIPTRLAPSGPPASGPDQVAMPDLTRRPVDVPAPGSTPLLRDATGAVLARWRPEGLGRVGVWSVTDSAGLVTAGFGQRYGDLWGTMVGALARPAQAALAVRFDSDPRQGRRLALCGLKGETKVEEPSGAWTRLLVDPATGPAACAGYWPATPGWRVLRLNVPGQAEPQAQGFYVRPAAQAPALAAEDDRVATLALAAAPAREAPSAGAASGAPGPRWPWFLAWLLAAAALWRFERASRGRAGTTAASPPS